MRLIDADALKKAIPNTHVDIFENCRNCRLLDNEQVKQLIDDSPTIELQKEQEAVKPKSKTRKGEYPQIVHRCGNCNEILYRYYKFCPSCGRSVKWE